MHRSKGQGYVPTRLGTMYQHLYTRKDAENTEEYSIEIAKVIANIMCNYTNSNKKRMSKKKFYQLVHTYSLQKGIKKFGVKGKQAAYKEMR